MYSTTIGRPCQADFQALIDPTSLQHDSNPSSIATADFNHDGFLDFIIANPGTNTIGLFLNTRNGTFASQKTFSTGDASRPRAVVAADFNNDTHVDVAVTNYDSHSIGIFLGDGNGIFAAPITFSTGVSRPVSLAVADLNRDRRLDIVIANSDTDSIGIFLGYGNGSFTRQTTLSTAYDSAPCSIVLKDFDRDQNIDIAVVNRGTDSFGVFLGYGNGKFRRLTVFSTGARSRPSSIVAADFNHDGHLDIAVVNSATDNIGIFLGYGNGRFRTPLNYLDTLGSNAQSIVVADFNQDNHVDVVVANHDTNDISILIGYGNGSFARPTRHSTGIDSGPLRMTIGDFINTNQSDIAVVNSVTNKVFILIGYTMMQSDNPPAYSTGNGSLPMQIAMGDFNNDTQMDLAVVSTGTDSVGIFFGYGNGSFREQVTYSTGNNSSPVSLAVADLDDDGRLDIVIANDNSHTIGILYGFENGIFTQMVAYSTEHSSTLRSVIVNDLNNDGQRDIAFADYGTNSIGMLLGKGNRTFDDVMTFTLGIGARPISIVVGDFNDDGRVDMAVACYGTANVGVLLGSGNGTFSLLTNYFTGEGSRPHMINIADLNNDSYLDIIIANIGANNVGIFFGFGNGSFAPQMIYSTGPNTSPIWINIADLNNDHILDFAVVNENVNNVGVFLGYGNGSFGDQTTYPTGTASSPNAMVINDFNGDNRLDIAVVNSVANNVALLFGHPAAGLSDQAKPILLGEYYADFLDQVSYRTGAGLRRFSVAVGDLNNDKRMDLVVTHSGDSSLGIFLGHGNGSFNSEVIYLLEIGSNPQNLIMDDFNGDNLLDIAVTNPRKDSVILLLGNGTGTFSSKIAYSTGSGSNPNALTVGNMNNDQYLDLLVADAIGIFYGFNYTLFDRRILGDTGENSGPLSIAIADFNNDNHLDAAVALYDTNKVGVFLNNGNETFRSVMNFADVPASHPWSIAVGDFNNDQQLDITIAEWGLDSIGIILGYGNGSFKNPILYSIGSGTRPVFVTVGDFNHDHSLDIISANYGGDSVALFLGYGNGTFDPPRLFFTGQDSAPNSVTVADVNNDTYLDLVIVNNGKDNIGICLGDGNGNFTDQITFSSGSGSAPWYAVAADVNNDGYLDLTISNWGTRNIGILYGYGNGTFGELQILITGNDSKPINVDVGDFNKDGYLDIVYVDDANTNIGVFFGYSNGTFSSLMVIPTSPGFGPIALAVADFNNDQQLDFFVADFLNSNIEVYLASGSRPFGGQTTIFIDEHARPSSIAVGHFNNDTLLDIVTANSGTNIIGVLLGYGNRLFSNMSTYYTGLDSHPTSLAVGDFNNDTLTDLVVVNSNTSDLLVFIGHGNGSFSRFISYSMGEDAQPVSITVGYFNRDNQLDIAIANFGTNNVCVLFGCGNGSFVNQTWYPLGYDSRPNWIVSKDLNNDDRDDLVVVTYGVDNIEILLNIC